MSSYTILVTDEQDLAIAYMAGGGDAALYLQQQVNLMLGGWVRSYQVSVAYAPVQTVDAAYLAAQASDQEQVCGILGVAQAPPGPPYGALPPPPLVPR